MFEQQSHRRFGPIAPLVREGVGPAAQVDQFIVFDQPSGRVETWFLLLDGSRECGAVEATFRIAKKVCSPVDDCLNLFRCHSGRTQSLDDRVNSAAFGECLEQLITDHDIKSCVIA